MSHFEKKTEEKNKFTVCNFCSGVSAVLPFPNTSLLMPFFAFNDVFTYLKKFFRSVLHFSAIFISCCFLDFLFSELAMFLCFRYSS